MFRSFNAAQRRVVSLRQFEATIEIDVENTFSYLMNDV